MKTAGVVLLLILMASVCFADGPPPTTRYLVESDSGDVSLVRAKSPNTFIGMNDLLLIWYFSLYTGGANFALYDSADIAADGDVLTINVPGYTMDWQPGGSGETNTLSDTGTFLADSGFGLAQTKAGVDLRIRGLIEGGGITITQRGDTGLQIDASGGTGWNWSDSSTYGPDSVLVAQQDTAGDDIHVTYVHSAGDTMSGDLDFGGNNALRLLRVSGAGTGGDLNIQAGLGRNVGIFDSLDLVWRFNTDSLIGRTGTVIKDIDSLQSDYVATDTIGISGDAITDFAGTGLSVDGSGVLNAAAGHDSTYESMRIDSANIDTLTSDTITTRVIVSDSSFAGKYTSTGAASGTLTLEGATSGSASITVADIAGTPSEFVLPTSDGSAGDHLETDGAGVTSWETSGGAGIDTADVIAIVEDSIATMSLDSAFIGVSPPKEAVFGATTTKPGYCFQEPDAHFGDATSGMISIGDGFIAHGTRDTTYNTGLLDLGGTMIFRQSQAVDRWFEFAFFENGGDLRFVIPTSGVGLGTYNSRSMFIAGPATLNDSVTLFSYWGFSKIDANTATTGADLGVQDDLEVMGKIYVDTFDNITAAPIEVLADLALNSNDITGADSVDIAKYTDGSIDLPDLATNSVDSQKILDGSIFESDLDISNSPTDNYLLSANTAGNNFTWVAGGAGETNTLEDTGTFNGTSGFGLAGGKTGTALKVKGLIEGANITITADGDSAYSIASSGGASVWSETNDSNTYYFGTDTIARFYADDDTTFLESGDNGVLSIGFASTTVRVGGSGLTEVQDSLLVPDAKAWNGVVSVSDSLFKTAYWIQGQIFDTAGAIRGEIAWTDGGTVIYPTSGADDSVLIGGTTSANSDISLNGDGSAVFNEQGAGVSFRVEGDTSEVLFEVNGSKADTGEVNINGGFNITLPSDDNMTIDGRTFPREITSGAMRWNHTPEAATMGTRAIFLDVDANSVPSTEGLHIAYRATALVPGERGIGIDIEAITANSSGGIIDAINISKSGFGAAVVHALHVDPSVDDVIHHESGTFGDVDYGFDSTGGVHTDFTAALNSSAIDSTIFDNDNDVLYIGEAAQFSDIDVVMNTFAGGAGIDPVFEFSISGPGWTVFTPIDNTAGFREDGLISWIPSDLTSWAAVTVNGQSAFWVRITRTRNSIPVDPIEDKFQTVLAIEYTWNSTGDLNINSILFEGTMDDAFEQTLNTINPTADRAFNFPDDQLVAGDVLVASDASDLEYVNLASTEILIGDGSGVPTAAALSGDATMDNTGLVDVTSADLADDVDTTGTNIAAALAERVDTAAHHDSLDIVRDEIRDTVNAVPKTFKWVIPDPNVYYDIDSLLCFEPVTAGAITITRIDVTCDADPATEPAMSLRFADNFISRTTPTTIDVITTTAGVTTITSGFDDATVPSGNCIYLALTAQPIAAIKTITFKVTYTVD